jgi:CHASE2 domain-containing sensor protein
MSKLVIFTLLGGDLNQESTAVTAQFWHQDKFIKITGNLPKTPELNQLYQRWQILYEAIHQRLGNSQRIKVHRDDITNVSVNDFDEVCQKLQKSLNAWLRFESFQNIERQLRTLLAPNDEIRIIIETNVAILHSLPWHLWDFLDDYPQAELGLSNHQYASPSVLQKSSTGKVKILAILGNKVGIDINRDSYLLRNLVDSQTKFLVEPTRKELDEQLWNHDWDILFFAGHSTSLADGDTGKIYINETESLSIYQLKNALKKAIQRGLSIAIFNSCDGIGLARNLAELNIPQMIVMRNRVPDFVAQEFLKYFLIAFADNKPLYLTVREARERLQGLENDFPCASWLPVIFQNPTTVPITWQQLRGNFNQTTTVEEVSTQNTVPSLKTKLLKVLISSFIVALSTITLRYLGIFEKIELQSFDQMLQLKPKEDLDSRVVVVEITEEDIQSRQEITLGAKSISDSTLAKLLNKLQKYQPQVIGLDIYRDFADPVNKFNRIQLSSELSKDNIVVACKGQDEEYDSQGVKPPEGVPLERQGFTDAIKDSDGIVRRQILMMQQEPTSSCETQHSLSLQLASRYLSDKNIPTLVDSESIIFDTKEIKLLKPGNSGAYQQNVDLGGIQILVNYRNTDSYLSVSLTDVLNDKVSAKILADKVLLIGVTANTVSDNWFTPYSSTKQAYQEIPGVVIQAQKVSQILSAVFNNRPILWALPFWGDIIWICGWTIMGSMIIWRIDPLSTKVFSSIATVVVLYVVCAFALLNQGLWLPFIPSAFGIIVGGIIVIFVRKRSDFFTIQ